MEERALERIIASKIKGQRKTKAKAKVAKPKAFLGHRHHMVS